MAKPVGKTAGHLLALFTVLIWGVTFISTKVVLRSINSAELFFLRYGLAFVALFLAFPRRVKFQGWRREGLYLLAGVCGVSLYFLLENLALLRTYASNVSVIIAVAPLFTAIFSRLFFKGEPLRLNFILGFICAIAGIFLISFNGSLNLKLNPLGDLLAVGAALVWAMYSHLSRKIGEFGFNTIQNTRRIFLYGLITMIPALFFYDCQWDFSVILTPAVILNILFLGLVGSALCYVTWNTAIGSIGPVKTSVYIYLVPVVTVIASVLFLGEQITWMSGLGTLLALAGLFISERRSARGTTEAQT